MLKALGAFFYGALVAALSACGGGGSGSNAGGQIGVGSAVSASGTLLEQASMNNYGSVYFDQMSSTKTQLKNGEVLKLEAKFIWDSNPLTPQHAVLNFSQAAKSNNLVNADGRLHFTHGAGAIVSDEGMAIELWFVDDLGSPGLDDDQLNAHIWSQNNNRCVVDVLGTQAPNSACLSDSAAETSYITPVPDFALKGNVPYTLRITLSRNDADHARAWLFAQLLEPCADTAVCGIRTVQSARTGFAIDQYFPFGDIMNAGIARTPGVKKISYTVTNGGF